MKLEERSIEECELMLMQTITTRENIIYSKLKLQIGVSCGATNATARHGGKMLTQHFEKRAYSKFKSRKVSQLFS